MTTKTYRISMATDEIDDFTGVCLKAGWAVLDTGERVTTDEGEDAEAVLLVTVFNKPTSKERIAVPL